MKTMTRKRRRELLKEFFLNASLIALVNELGEEMARLDSVLGEGDPGALSGEPAPVPVPAA